MLILTNCEMHFSTAKNWYPCKKVDFLQTLVSSQFSWTWITQPPFQAAHLEYQADYLDVK